MIHAEISIYPIGTGSTSISFYVARALEAVQDMKNLRYQLTPMGTLLESDDIDVILSASAKMLNAVHGLGASRVGFSLKVDSRRDKQTSLESKVSSVRAHQERF